MWHDDHHHGQNRRRTRYLLHLRSQLLWSCSVAVFFLPPPSRARLQLRKISDPTRTFVSLSMKQSPQAEVLEGPTPFREERDVCAVLTIDGRTACNSSKFCVFSEKNPDAADEGAPEVCHTDFCSLNESPTACTGTCYWNGAKCINIAKRDPLVSLDFRCREASSADACAQLFPRCSMQVSAGGCRAEPRHDFCAENRSAGLCKHANENLVCIWRVLDATTMAGRCERDLATAGAAGGRRFCFVRRHRGGIKEDTCIGGSRV
eukprot:CAMPEP_0179009036 /NCGR_PEP_ID=MMETSP0795-20121207/16056_1 /TAXON_ID=88552 /ORGANISM="Amoebophrya sp., Strain Ameob2" /LENGTH=261 /DNA_ID=CAMNT_0020704203 /DNA_START=95 /DNA_END=880 /DNA_ORIENTATION=+